MLQKLKNLDMERMDLDEAIELLSVANAMRVTYDAEQVEVPEWVDTSIRELKREIRSRQQDSRERRLKELKARREALATVDEKRAKIDREIADLEKLATQ